MARRTLLPALLLALLALPACKRLQTGAREEFSKRYSCPEARVEVRGREDLSVWDVMIGVSPEPLPEVAADPERLALWQDQQAETKGRFERAFTLFEVRGCGHQVLLACAHPSAPDNGVYVSAVTCTEGRYPPGATRWAR